MTGKLEDTQFRARMRLMNQTAQPSLRAAMATLGAIAAGKIARGAIARAYDTGRTARAFQLAANDLASQSQGQTSMVAVTAVRPSKAARSFRPRVESQIHTWLEIRKIYDERLDAEMTIAGSGTKGSKRVSPWLIARTQKSIDKINIILNRLIAVSKMIDADNNGEASSGILLGGKKINAEKPNLTSVARLIVKLYGGAGMLRDVGETVIAEIHNYEPHGLIVEKRTRIGAIAMADARAAGIPVLRKNFLDKLHGAKAA